MPQTPASVPATFLLGATPPPDPQPSTIWRSTSMQDMRVSHDPADRSVLIAPTLSWEGSIVQEPTVWFYGGRWHMLYNGQGATPALGYASTAGPSPRGPWTKAGAPVLGAGNGGLTGGAYHHSVYLEGATLYCTYVDQVSNVWKLATASANAPTVWTIQSGTYLATPAIYAGSGPLGNTCLFKDDDSTYLLLFEYPVQGSLNYQIGFARATSPSGPWTIDAAMLTTLWPNVFTGNAGGTAGIPGGAPGGPWLVKENGVYILLFHSLVNTAPGDSVATEGYRATSTDLINWTVDPGNSFVRRLAPQEVDQVADLALAQATPGGPALLTWTGYDNLGGKASIMAAPLRPVDRHWDGERWTIVGGPIDAGRPRPTLYAATLGSTFTTSTVGSDVSAGLAITYTPDVNCRASVKARSLVSSSAAGVTKTRLKMSTTAWAGYTQDDETHSLAVAETRTFRNELEVELLAGTTYTFTLYVNNAAAGATTTVASGSASTALGLTARPW